MKRRFLAIAAVAAGMLSGCISQSNEPAFDSRVTVAPDLCGDVAVTDARCAKGDSSFLAFQANLANRCASPTPVQWRVQWLDADGMEIESVVSSWNALMLQPYEIRGLKSRAPVSDAADMRFYVRRAK